VSEHVPSQQPGPDVEPELEKPETDDLHAVDLQQPEAEAEPEIVTQDTDDLPVVIDLKKKTFFTFF